MTLIVSDAVRSFNCGFSTIMAPVQFKLKYAGLTRRAYFEDLPNWSDLSAKVNILHGLPLNNIAVTFTDIDDEEIAVSSDAELQEFYHFSYRDGVIKLNVLDLSLSRAEPSSTSVGFTRSLPNSPESTERPSKRVRLAPQTPINTNKAAPPTVGALFFSFHQALCTFFDSVTPTPASSRI